MLHIDAVGGDRSAHVGEDEALVRGSSGVGPHMGGFVVVFLPGFMSAASSYRALLEPLSEQGISVLVPQLYRRGLAALSGRATVLDEAVAAAALVRRTAVEHPHAAVVLGGQSRGGQAAWRAANLLATEQPGEFGRVLPEALVLIDPVDGEGRDSSRPSATVSPAAFTGRTLVIGAGIGGRCAPDPVNPRQFAAATPQARHDVVTDLGHADILEGRARSLGRRLCGGGRDPDRARDAVTALLAAVTLNQLDDVEDSAGALEWLIR